MSDRQFEAMSRAYSMLDDCTVEEAPRAVAVEPVSAGEQPDPLPMCPWCDQPISGPCYELGTDRFHTACWREYGVTLGAAGVEEVPGT
jgi:hypothetical protein